MPVDGSAIAFLESIIQQRRQLDFGRVLDLATKIGLYDNSYTVSVSQVSEACMYALGLTKPGSTAQQRHKRIVENI